MRQNYYNISNINKKIVAGILAVLLVFTSLSGVIGISFGTSASALVSLPFKNVTGELDFSEIVKQNFNSTVLTSSQTKVYEDRTVIISLSGKSLADASEGVSISEYVSCDAGKSTASLIKAEQDEFLQKLSDAGIEYTLEHRYMAVDNAVAVKINTRYVSSIRSMQGVDYAVIAGSYAYPKDASETSGAVINTTKVYSTGVYDSSEAVADGLDGSGTVVAIIDTGLDYTHQAFSEMPNGVNPVSLTEEAVKTILAEKELKAEDKNAAALSVADVYINAKIPFAYDYADNDSDVYPSYSTHGTHVAGIVAGHDAGGYTDKDGNHVDEEFIGVAPQAQLMICKVFTDDLESTALGGAETEDILAALEDCILLGVDVINMSLGTSCGFTSTNDGDDEGEYLDRVYNAIGEQGISLVCAASNDYSSGYGSVFGTNLSSNPDSGTVGSPATFSSALAVASISGKLSPYLMGNGSTAVFFEESNDEDNNPFDFLSMMLGEDGQCGEFEYVVIPGEGRASDYTSAIKQLFAENPNRIALVERGGNTFKEKVEVAKSMGAMAIIVYNNVSGTIRMSLGDVKDPIPSASIGMNAGAALVYAAMNHTQEEIDAGAVNRVGTLVLDRSYLAGPFMSEFSSWGATPDLKLKPEITAHGGEITSTVPGGYGEQSGTSMASPNMAGVVALVRGYVKTKYPEMTSQEVTRRVNQLLMSTATTVYDRDGLPYSPRKQGAGLGSLDNARTTSAYLWTDNAEIDYRPKFELGDDASKNGIYTVQFLVTNFGLEALSFRTQSLFMTETLAIDGLSVAEQAYMLNDIPAVWTVDGNEIADGDSFAVPAGKTAVITLTVTLSDTEKKYIDDSFSNGMYVEGFAKLLSETDGQCDLALPFMGFYGDWSDAPMLDYDAYELSDYQQDSSILEDEKPQAAVWATQPYTVYSNEEYVLPMGSYVYLLPDDADEVYLSMDHNAISCYNEYFGENDADNYLTSYKMKGLYAGLLRNARSVEYTLINADTGEILENETVNRIGKAYSDGGSARPAFVDVPIDPVEYELVSNGRYTMTFEFWLDYGDGTCTENTFTFDFTVDYEAPLLEDIRIRYYDYKDGNKTKQRIYLDLDVFDNHYAQSAMLCYLKGDELVLATEYVTPVYNSNFNGTTTVSIEITDIYDTYKDCLYVQLDDYALNHSVYWLNLSAVNPSSSSKTFDLADGEEALNIGVYDTHTVILSGAEECSLSNFQWTSDNRSVADVRNGEIVGLSEGVAKITVSNGSGVSKTISVTVSSGSKKLDTPSISFGAVKNGDGVLTKAQGTVEVYPGNTFKLNVQTDPWYYPVGDLTLQWESTDPSVAIVDGDGTVTAIDEGTAVVKATIIVDGRLTVYTASVTLDVKDPYIVSNYSLVQYKGQGGVVVIPTDKNIMQIGENAFKDNDTVTEVVIPKSVTEIGKGAFENCTALKKVCFDSPEEQPIADSDISVIYARAFAGCTSLEVLDLSNVKVVTLGRECFAGCTSLKEIRKMAKIGSAYAYAFAGCTSLTELDLTALHVSGIGAFSGCTSLEKITTGKFTSIGEEMFKDCVSLRSVVLSSQTVGKRAFYGCTGLRSVTVALPDGEKSFTYYIEDSAFADCSALQSFKVESGCKIAKIGAYAFGSTALTMFTMPSGVTTLGGDILSGSAVKEILLGGDFSFEDLELLGNPFGSIKVCLTGNTNYVISDGVLYNKDKTKLFSVLSGTVSVNIPETVTSIGDYAFAGSDVSYLKVPASVTSIGTGAFAESKLVYIDLTAVSLKSVPEKAFYRSYLTEISIPDTVTYIGDLAFAYTPLSSLKFKGAVSELGDSVFAGCELLKEAVLPESISVMGSNVFFGCTSLEKVSMPSVKELGSSTFSGCTSLKYASFADKATTLGDFTFYRNSALISVEFGDDVTEIGSNVFYACDSLEKIDIHSVTSIGDNAFAECCKLSEVSGLNRVVSVGDMAFYNCNSLACLDLKSAEYVGAGAFAIENGGTSYTDLSIPSVKQIGIMAFMGGGEAEVSIPMTLETLGYGAFSGSKELTRFTVDAQNKTFFAEDGVLYKVLPNGTYSLCAYPSGASGENGIYTVIDGASSVEAYAFNRLRDGVLDEVILPYSVKSIGVSAFFESGITVYTFQSIQAPTLYTVYREDVASLLESNVTGNQVAINGLYYTNFESLFAQHTEIVGEKSELSKKIPENGVGYDNYIYTNYFGKTASLGILMDDVTRAAINAIDALEDAETVEGWSSLEVNDSNKAFLISFAEQVKEARRLYNNILTDAQRDFVGDERVEKLTSIESLMRALKLKFGIPLVISDIRAEEGYKKEYTEGESFSMDGLVLTIVYDDFSVEIADNKKLVLKTPSDGILTVYDNFVVFEYYYGTDGVSYKEVNIPVSVKAGGSSGATGGMPIWLTVLLIATAVIAAGVGGVAVYRRGKPSAKAGKAFKPAKKRRQKPLRQRKPINPLIGKIFKWAFTAVFVAAAIALIIFAVISGGSAKEKAPEITSHIVYNANGGLFENNMAEKTIGYADETYPLEIGAVAVTNGSANITRQSHLFTGWYYPALDTSGEIIYEDGTVKLGAMFDFTKPMTDGQEVTLYAGWVKEKTLPVLLAGEAVTDKNGKTYQVGDVIRELTANVQGEFVKYTGSNLLSLKNGQYTFVQYYTDAECTAPVTWPIVSEGDEAAEPIYAMFISGDWKIVSDADSAAKMLSSLISGNYYIIEDIDLGGNAVTISNSPTFGAVVEGNGHTVSNFKVTKRGVESQGTSLFGTFTESAALHDITLSDISFEIMLKGDANALYFLFGSMPENADIYGVSVGGKMSVSCPEGSVIGNLQSGEHTHWIISAGESDEEALSDGKITVDVTCTVGDQVYSYPDID